MSRVFLLAIIAVLAVATIEISADFIHSVKSGI
jgi:hypothetical protein